jgi:hypothetical protein
VTLVKRPIRQEVSTDSLKFLCPVGGPPPKRPRSRLWGGPPDRQASCGLLQFYPLGYPTLYGHASYYSFILRLILKSTLSEGHMVNGELVSDMHYTLFESLWFSFAAVLSGGTESVPRSLSARFLTSVWWFVSLIFCANYTANLAAFMTAQQIPIPVKDVHDLIQQKEIKVNSAIRRMVEESDITNISYHIKPRKI